MKIKTEAVGRTRMKVDFELNPQDVVKIDFEKILKQSLVRSRLEKLSNITGDDYLSPIFTHEPETIEMIIGELLEEKYLGLLLVDEDKTLRELAEKRLRSKNG